MQQVTSSPTYAQSNGQRERCVQTVKKMLMKAADEGSDVYLSLLEYRNTPITGTSRSPAQMLMERALCSKVPVTSTTLAPDTVNPRQQLLQQQRQPISYCDWRARPLRTLQPGDIVRIPKNNAWSDPGAATLKDDTPHSYWINNGTWLLRRNRKHLLNLALTLRFQKHQ